MTYATNNSGRLGQPVSVVLNVSFFPGSFTVRVVDENAQTSHELSNRRFNFQSRDSPVDLLARDKWRSWWFDRFTGIATLECPQIRGVPTELKLTLISRWEPAFAVVEFQLADTFYQLACRPPRGVSVWTRLRFTCAGITREHEVHDAPNEPSSGSTQVPIDDVPEPPVRPHHQIRREV